MLNAAEMKPIGDMGYNSSATVHCVGEAMCRVFADRANLWEALTVTRSNVERYYARGAGACQSNSSLLMSSSTGTG